MYWSPFANLVYLAPANGADSHLPVASFIGKRRAAWKMFRAGALLARPTMQLEPYRLGRPVLLRSPRGFLLEPQASEAAGDAEKPGICLGRIQPAGS